METRGRKTYALRSGGGVKRQVNADQMREILSAAFGEQSFSDEFVETLAREVENRTFFATQRPLLWRDCQKPVAKIQKAAKTLLTEFENLRAIDDGKGADLVEEIGMDLAKIQGHFDAIPTQFLVLMANFDLRDRYFDEYTPARGNRAFLTSLRKLLKDRGLDVAISETSAFFRLLEALETEFNCITPDNQTSTGFYEYVRKSFRINGEN